MAGCRLGFTEQPVTGSDAAVSMLDAPPADAPPDARIVAQTFGERVGSMHTGVSVDTTVALDQPTMNYGLLEDISLSGGGTVQRGLLRFDLSAIAPGTLVVAARLDVELVDFGDNLVGGVALRVAGEAWAEATATWNERQTGTAWTTGGGTASAAFATIATPGAAVVFTVPANIPQSWIDAPATNFGFIISASNEGLDTHYHVHTSEAQVLTGRPLLVLDVVQ